MGNSTDNTENTGSPKDDTERRIIKGEKVKKTTEEIVELKWWQKLTYVIYFIGLFLALTYLLLTLWPHAPPAGETAVAAPVWHVWIFKLTISEDIRYIMIVAVMGALGGLAFSARSYAYFVGEKKFKISYTCWYILRPVIGSILAVIFYFAFRAAFFSLSASTQDLNLFGIATLGGIVGLFSAETIKKLDDLFKRILPSKRERTERG